MDRERCIINWGVCKNEQTVEGCARQGAVFTQGRTCAREHVGRAVRGANAYHQAPLGTEKCVGVATPI